MTDSYTGAAQGETGIDPYLYSRSIRGVPSNHNRTHKARCSSWDTHYGIASDGTPVARRIGYQTVGGPVTVTYADGTTVEKDPAEFRRPKTRTSKKAVAAQNDRQARRLALLASVGNHSELASGDC